MVSWTRNERVAADTRRGAVLAQRVVSAVALRRRRHRLWWCVLAAAAACVLVSSVVFLAGGDATPSIPAVPDDRQTAEIYAAAIGGGSGHLLAHPVLVRDTVCASIPDQDAACPEGRPIPAAVRTRVIQLLGSGVRFVPTPQPPPRREDPWTVAFGDLAATAGGVTLGVERNCGPLCGSGETIVLARRGGHWVVTGSTGPAWNN